MRMRGETSNRNPHIGLAGGNVQIKMVHLSGETSNQLFEVLADWNAQLTSCSLYENPEELPFQLDGAASQKTADSANSDGEEPVETYGSGSWTG